MKRSFHFLLADLKKKLDKGFALMYILFGYRKIGGASSLGAAMVGATVIPTEFLAA